MNSSCSWATTAPGKPLSCVWRHALRSQPQDVCPTPAMVAANLTRVRRKNRNARAPLLAIRRIDRRGKSSFLRERFTGCKILPLWRKPHWSLRVFPAGGRLGADLFAGNAATAGIRKGGVGRAGIVVTRRTSFRPRPRRCRMACPNAVELINNEGCTVLMSSHGQNESTALATRAIAMRSGTVVADSGPQGDVRTVMEEHAVSAGHSSAEARSL